MHVLLRSESEMELFQRVPYRRIGVKEMYRRFPQPHAHLSPFALSLELGSLADIDNAVTALALLNVLRYGARNADPLFARYLAETGTNDVFLDAMQVRVLGYGDCEDLSAAALAQAWILGATAFSAATLNPEPHARLRIGNVLYDPSFLWRPMASAGVST